MPTNHLIIKGKVQGVFYRAGAKKVANKTGITGWIKNLKEGHVEATISGSEGQLEKFIHWCKQGPPDARVEEVIITPKEETVFDRFVIVK